jgi:hypothetical protein
MSTVHSAGPDKVFERLKKDSEDIDIALDQFMKEREAALNVQLHARNDYDNDMKRLDESDLLIDYEKMLRNTVDHNLMRHLNVAVEGTGNSIVGDEYGDGAFDEEEEQQPEPMPDDSRPNNYIETKRPMPSFEEKAALREQLFAFLDESRLQELQIVSCVGFCAYRSQCHSYLMNFFVAVRCCLSHPVLVGHEIDGPSGADRDERQWK